MRVAAALLFSLVFIYSDTFPQERLVDQWVGVVTSGVRYDLLSWEVNALSKGIADYVGGTGSGGTSAEDSDHVRKYFDAAAKVAQLEDRQLYLASLPKPNQSELNAVASEIASARQTVAQMEARAGSILTSQVSWALRNTGLQCSALGAQVLWPPLMYRFVDLPLLLVVSRRDRIDTLAEACLDPGLSIEEMEKIENELEDEGWSALVTNIGGLGTYPSMLTSRYGLGFLLSTIPHEWMHDFLAFRPLGWQYGTSGELTTINETVCDIVGNEIGQIVAGEFYPEWVTTPQETTTPPAPQDPSSFDFGTEMRATRLEVDRLLARGQVDEAEAYMEQRRQVFVEHGYAIRRLNQAYFAFFGSYATGPGSVSPIGRQLQDLRSRSASLRDFVMKVSGMDSYDDLLSALGLPVPAQ